MFGYVRPDFEHLSGEDKQIFQSHYCGLCKAIQRRYGGFARMTLSFDLTFLALLLGSLEPREAETGRAFCAKKRTIMLGETMDACADINVLLAYYNAWDAQKDDPSIQRRGARALLQSSYHQAKQRHLFLDTHLEEHMQRLWRMEQEGCSEPDLVSHSFGELLRGIVQTLCDHPDAIEMGYHLGRYIYLLDAVDDYERDMKKGHYNVYHQQYGRVDNLLERAGFGLECHLSQMVEHYEKLDIKRNKALLDNIVFRGLIQYFLLEREGA